MRIVVGTLVAVACVGYAVNAVVQFGLPTDEPGWELAGAGAAGLLASPQFFVFVVVPAWLWVTLASLGGWLAQGRLIRHGSRCGAVAHRLVRVVVTLVLGLLGVVVLSGVATVVSGLFVTSIDQMSVAIAYADRLATAWILVGTQIIVDVLSLATISALLLLAALTRHARWLPLVLAAIFWLWIVVSTTGMLPSDHGGNAATYLDGIALLVDPLGSAPRMLPECLVLGGSVLGAWAMDARARGLAHPAAPWSALLLVVLGTAVATATRDGGSGNASFTSVLALPLHSNGTILQFLGAAIFTLTLAAIVLAKRSDRLNGWQQQVAIRHGSWWRILRSWVATETCRAVMVMALLFLVAVVSFFVPTPPRESPDLPGIALQTYQWLVNGALQLTFVAVVAWALETLGAGQAVTLSILAVAGVAGALTSPLSQWLPFPFTTGYTRFGGWDEALIATLVCLGWIGGISAAVVSRKNLARRRSTS